MNLPLPQIKLFLARRLIVVILIAAASFGGGYFFGSSGFKAQINNLKNITITRETPPDKAVLNFSLFWRVWDTLSAKYFDKSKLVPSEMVYGAIKGMVSSLGDPYTVFLSPKENKVVREDLGGSFEGVGIQIGFKGTQLAVIAPLPGSPAEAAGVKAGDFIIGIKDEGKKIDMGTVGISLPEAVEAIRGKAGSTVTLTLLREGSDKPIVVDIVRQRLIVPSVSLEFVGKDKDIAHIKLLKFGGETNREWEEAIKKVLDGKARAIILDLRNDPGGYLQAAVDIASEFLKNESLVVIEERSDGGRTEYKAERAGRLRDVPVVILVNEGTASASEILAGALRDDKKTKLVGKTTFGKGTIQEPQEIEGGAGLHITVARWLTPSGFWVNEKGLEPDVKIKDDEKTPEDEQLNEAIKLLE